MRKIIVHCHAINGHQLEYLHHIYIGALHATEDEFLFVVPPRFETDRHLLDWPEASHIKIELMGENDLPKTSGILRSSYLFSKYLSRSVKRFNATHVILISLIAYLPFLPFLISSNVRIRGIIYRIYLYEWKEEGLLKRVLDAFKYSLLRGFRVFERVFILNDAVSARYLNKRFRTEKFYYLPDPVAIIPGTVGHNIRRELGIDDNRILLLHPGSMNAYKGTLNILRALDNMPQEAVKQLVLITAGQTREIRNQFEQLMESLQNRVRIIHIEGYITFEELANLFVSADYVIIPYTVKSQSSGIVGHAAYFKKPVIVGREGLIGRMVRQYHLGFCLTDVTPKSISDFLTDIPRWRYVNNRYVEEHNINDFGNILLN